MATLGDRLTTVGGVHLETWTAWEDSSEARALATAWATASSCSARSSRSQTSATTHPTGGASRCGWLPGGASRLPGPRVPGGPRHVRPRSVHGTAARASRSAPPPPRPVPQPRPVSAASITNSGVIRCLEQCAQRPAVLGAGGGEEFSDQAGVAAAASQGDELDHADPVELLPGPGRAPAASSTRPGQEPLRTFP